MKSQAEPYREWKSSGRWNGTQGIGTVRGIGTIQGAGIVQEIGSMQGIKLCRKQNYTGNKTMRRIGTVWERRIIQRMGTAQGKRTMQKIYNFYCAGKKTIQGMGLVQEIENYTGNENNAGIGTGREWIWMNGICSKR